MEIKNLNDLSREELIKTITDLQGKLRITSGKLQRIHIDYHSLLEATSDIIFVIDKEGNFVYINSAWKVFYPSWAGRNLGGHFLKNIPSIEHDRATFVFNEVMKGKTFENEIMKSFNEEGKTVYFTASFSPIKSPEGEIVGLVGIMKNITEKHLAEKKSKEYSRMLEAKVKEQLAQSHELKGLRDFNEDIINHAPIGIFVMDPSGIILSENPALKQIMGHSPTDTLVGMNILNEAAFTDSGLGALNEQCRAEKRTVRSFNIPYRAFTSGRHLIINVTVVPVIDAKGTIEKIIFMVEDHTEQAAITSRVYESEKLSALGILASGVASELRNCINRMVMDLNFIDNNVEDGSPADGYIDSLHQELNRIKNITEQLVSLSSADEENRELIDLNKVLASHPIELMVKRLRSEGFDMTITPSPEPATIRANQNQLQQLLLQFIENAEEAMPEKGSISITVETTNAGSHSYAIMTISDTGIGIPEENMQKIFQPFFTTKGTQATGLGLMITSAIVQSLGGTIGLKSRPGEGTSFKIVLPVAEHNQPGEQG
ncbi:MAG: PAS domain S-box protein [Spirochaetes bacterium]|nr:PAS domain S-box protein [Spirochaetota bacterium]